MCYSGLCPFENKMGDCTLPFGEEKCPPDLQPQEEEEDEE